jgi:threonine dehydrogenase-like Zn-dependent dehydrogenase
VYCAMCAYSSPLQQCAIRWAALAGAKRIYAIDKVDSRLQLARKGAKPGVVQTIHFEQLDELDNVVEYLLAKCPEGLDVAIDCTSHDPKVCLAVIGDIIF